MEEPKTVKKRSKKSKSSTKKATKEDKDQSLLIEELELQRGSSYKVKLLKLCYA